MYEKNVHDESSDWIADICANFGHKKQRFDRWHGEQRLDRCHEAQRLDRCIAWCMCENSDWIAAFNSDWIAMLLCVQSGLHVHRVLHAAI